MNVFDIFVMIVILFCFIRGGFKGLIGEISGIIGVVAGFYGAYTYYPMIAGVGQQWISDPGIRNILAFILLFCAVLIGVILASILIRKLLNIVFLGWVDRAFGIVFGAAKGVLIVSVIFIVATQFIPENSKFMKDSKFSPYIAQVSRHMTVFISQHSRKDLLKKLEEIKFWKQ